MGSWSIPVRMLKVADGERRMVSGWAMVTQDAEGRHIFDHQGDAITIDELEKACVRAIRKGFSAGDMHERVVDSEIAGLYPLDSAERQAFGFGEGPGGLMVKMRINDDALLEDVKAGRKTELSIGGAGERVAA